METNGNQWKPMETNGNQWKPNGNLMETNGNQQKPQLQKISSFFKLKVLKQVLGKEKF